MSNTRPMIGSEVEQNKEEQIVHNLRSAVLPWQPVSYGDQVCANFSTICCSTVGR